MAVSKAMVMCIIKPNVRWQDIGGTTDYFRTVAGVIRGIEEKSYFLYSQDFTNGDHNHEKMAFIFMTSVDSEKIYTLVSNACGNHYDVHILN